MKWRNTKKSNCKPTPINTRQLQSFSRYFLRLRFGSPKQHKQNHLWPHIKIKYSENRNQNQSEISPNLEFGLRHFSTIPRIPLRVSAFRDAKGPWTTEAMLLELMHLGRQLQCSWPAELHQLLAVPPRTQDDPGWPRMTQGTPGDGMGVDGHGQGEDGWFDMIWYELMWCDYDVWGLDWLDLLGWKHLATRSLVRRTSTQADVAMEMEPLTFFICINHSGVCYHDAHLLSLPSLIYSIIPWHKSKRSPSRRKDNNRKHQHSR